MEFNISMHSDRGLRKETNQDSLCIKEAKTDEGNILLALVCDGMGGLEKGELASATVIRAFEKWFEAELPYILNKDNVIDEIRYRWGRIIKEQNQIISDYGREERIQLGTTVTVMLFLENGDYIIGHVGDTRAYRITDETITQLTEDQTVVARDVRMGRLTEEQALEDPRRNVLLQCIGASKIVEPEFFVGKYQMNEVYMLCSDGFRHEITTNELLSCFKPSENDNENIMKNNVVKLIELNMNRGESDNISAILIKVV